MSASRKVVEMRTAPSIADVEARRLTTVAELNELTPRLGLLRGRRGAMVLDGADLGELDAEIDQLERRMATLRDALGALDERHRRAEAIEAEQALARYNEELSAHFANARKLLVRWTRVSKEAGDVVEQLLPIIDSIRRQAAPGRELHEFAHLDRLPGAMVTQLCLGIVPADERARQQRAGFAGTLPAPPYEMAQVFLARGKPADLLAQALAILLQPEPEQSPPPEAA